VDEEQLAAMTVSSSGAPRRPTMVACSSAGVAPLVATPTGDVLRTAIVTRCGSVLEQRRSGDNGSARPFSREKKVRRGWLSFKGEESERGKEWGRLWFVLKKGRWRRGLDGARGSKEAAQACGVRGGGG
jgi:hypothetical protein